MRRRVHNLVEELHRKCAGVLCKHYRVVVVPALATQSMVARGGRRIGRVTARDMLSLAHGRFRARLRAKMREYPEAELHTPTEEYTSKICGNCGALNRGLGGRKDFRCGCGYESDRDANAARNILVKHLSARQRAHEEGAGEASRMQE